MIPRYQKYLTGALVLVSVVMSVLLWQLRDRAHQRLVAGEDTSPTQAPQVAPAEQATLIVADDSENTLLTQIHNLPLPIDPGSRARAVLGKLLDLYALSDAAHPVPGGSAGIAQVFLLPATGPAAAPPVAGKPHAEPEAKPAAPAQPEPQPAGPQLAVVNLTGSFVASHPSGIAPETLTVLSICGTLHANLPRVTQVRFLVDGQQRATLAGHADLTRTYLTGDAAPAVNPPHEPR